MADDPNPITIVDASSDSLLESAMDLRLIRRIAVDSAKAIYQLWNDEGGCYWRDTEQRRLATRKETSQFFPTVTYRSTEALLELVLRHPDWFKEPDVVREITTVHVPKIFSRPLATVVSALDDPGKRRKERNPFTTALYLITACRANEILKSPKAPVDLTEILSAAEHLLTVCTDKTATYISERHPFTQFHVIRAVNTLLPLISGKPLESQINEMRIAISKGIKAAIEKLLARRMLQQQLAPSDSVALVFCAAALAFDDRDDDKHYVLPALLAGFEAQEVSGCWPLGRVVRRFRRRHREARDFTISTYEIAWATSETLLKLLQHRESIPEDKLATALERLLAAGRYTERSSVELETGEPHKGWSSDPPYAESLIESWTSANVLQSIVSLNELIDEVRCNQTLKTFVVLDPTSEEWPSWKRWTSLRDKEEPDDEYPIFDYLATNIVEPILRNTQKLPSVDEETVSALFFGPPGTSKTTLAHALADALVWPIVLLSPGDFIEKGLEGIEAQARQVFSRLQKLRRAVVLFDECDELFRIREPEAGSEQQRNITAFVTACMLPKLQDLHDRGRVLFCICTNKFGSLDPAIQRGGRVDHVIGVPPPQAAYRKRIIERQFDSIADGDAKRAVIQTLVDNTERFTRLEIQRASQIILAKKVDWATANVPGLIKMVDEMAKKMEKSLTITGREYKDFEEAKSKFSHPVTRKEA
jgi:hypothetical protein